MSSDGRLVLPLEPGTDRFGKTFYIAKLKGPFTIDCKDGVCFLVFTSDPENPELQIANVLPPKDRDRNKEDQK